MLTLFPFWQKALERRKKNCTERSGKKKLEILEGKNNSTMTNHVELVKRVCCQHFRSNGDTEKGWVESQNMLKRKVANDSFSNEGNGDDYRYLLEPREV
ncbi:hypothetical protein CDAR_422591 [Caerostris darwini]|uniref:Uncharacterized protein n=1 Tax=Caerostris darwini TaxID=1538125 RepID=A0AAV4VXD6_9ARAC|nr:hypothetical protein CDAR_422591 [Caerostris darwini]